MKKLWLANRGAAPAAWLWGGGGGTPTLDLNFVSGAALDSRITFTRASTATYYDITGVRQTAGNNVPLLSFDPSTHAPTGWLIQDVRTNSLLNSGVPATQTTASLAAGTYCLWVEGSGTATSSAGTAVGSGFGAATAGSPNVFTTTGAGTVIITVSGSLTVFQLENGPFATSYIATAGTTATRARDLASVPVAPWFNTLAGTLLVEAMYPYGPVQPSFAYAATISDGSANNQITFRRNATTNNLSAIVTAGGVAALNATAGVTVSGQVFKSAIAYSAAGCGCAFNGVSGPSSGGSGSLAAVTSLFIGNQNNIGSDINGFVRRLRYWPRALSAGELRQVTL